MNKTKTKNNKLRRKQLDPSMANLLKKLSKDVWPNHKPPDTLTVSGWAEKNRVLPDSSAERGKWRTSRTPYLKEPMDAATDPRIRRIVVVSPSQQGKSELELNFIGRSIDLDPAHILYVHPTKEEAIKFSQQRVEPMIEKCESLRKKIGRTKSRDASNTKTLKTFPGGSLSLIGSNVPGALASIPARYLVGDERDRFAKSAGAEGDPWELALARQTTFYNAKAIEVSTPTIKGASPIEVSFYKGTQEKWCHQCPTCGEWVELDFDDIKFEFNTERIGGRKQFELTAPVLWCCPKCGSLHDEIEMRKQPQKWIAANPKAYENGIRSFWLNAWSSPWTPWKKICLAFLEAKDDPLRLKVVWNTLLGKLWEERGDIADEDVMLARREHYEAELPDGVLVLTMGVDTQDNRLEYEIVGYGKYGESWGIKRGFIMGRPDTAGPWEKLDELIGHVYHFKDGKGLRLSATLCDSGGHFTQEVYEACRARQPFRVFALKGKGGEGVPFTAPPSRVPIRENKNITCWLYTIGVDAGKAMIMANLKVAEPGAKYCHFPSNEEAGYNADFFSGLLSEHLVLVNSRNGTKWAWEKITGHNRNEPLDCRNYANAALRLVNPDMDVMERRLKGLPERQAVAPVQYKKPVKRRMKLGGGDDDW